MCKNPVSESPVSPNEELDVSGDESEFTDSDDSDFTEPSVDGRDSDSDAESSSGNRVTSEMVLLLMLKVHGEITDAEYARKAEMCEDDIKSLIPKIPRSASLVSLDYTKIDEQSNDGNSDNGLREILLRKLISGDEGTVAVTDRSELASHNNIDVVENDEVIENISDAKENSASDLFEKGTLQAGISNINEREVESHTNLDRVARDSLEIMKTAAAGTVNATDRSELASHKNIDSIKIDESLEIVCDAKEKSASDLLETGTLQDDMGNINGSEVESHTNLDTVATETLKITKPLERGTDDKQNAVSDWLLSNTNTNVDVVNKDQCNVDILQQQQGENIKVTQNESNREEMQDLQQAQVPKASRERPYHYQEQETVKCENILCKNYVDEMVTEGSDKGCGIHIALQCTITENIVPKVENTETMHMETDNDSMIKLKVDSTKEKKHKVENELEENTGEVVEDSSIETNNNASQDTAKIITCEESKMDQNTKDEFNTTGKITKSFNYILNKLVSEKRIIEEDDENRISDEYGQTYAESLRSFVRRLDDHYGPDMRVGKTSGSDDDDGGLRKFALYLNFYSPSSYNYILETFNTPLPEHKVLCTWYLKDNNEPGLTERAFKILKQKSSKKRLTCSLMFIDILLKNDGRYYDQVDYGAGPDDSCVNKAVFAYVFVLVSLDEDWKMPIGYLYVRTVPAETQAELIRVCLRQCHDAGADVVAVTLETLTPAEFLGCSFQDPKNLKTTFKHPACDRDVAVWIEPCLALKSARQTLKAKGVLLDYQGNRIRWDLIRELIRMHSTGIIIDFKKPEFYELQNHIAKVGLTTEIFSKSLAPALELSEKLLPGLFTETEPTRRYILLMNVTNTFLHSQLSERRFHILNYLYVTTKGYLIRTMCNQENGLSPFDRLNLAWKNERKGYRHFLRGEAACGFLGFLICIESLLHLYTTLIRNEKRMTSLNTRRLCKGRAEDFVTTLRVHSCRDPEYYSGEDFQKYYNTLLDALEKNPLFTDKSVPLEHWPLENRDSPAVTIKLTSGKRSYDGIYSSQYKLKKLRTSSGESCATNLVREFSKALDTEKDLSTRKNMVGYIAGWIAAKFAKCLKCETCIDALCTGKKLWFHKFVTLNQIYVCLPSEEIFRICWECERALRLKRTPASLRAWVLCRLAAKFPWSSRDLRHPFGHYIQLARAVINKYVPIRIPAPLSRKEQKKIIDMFKRFTSTNNDRYIYEDDELAEWM